MTPSFTCRLLAGSIAMALSGHALAQSADETKKKASDDAEIIIVSGTPGGAGIRKIDASFAVTNIDASDIEKLAPKSTADLFKAIPGVWVESSGGESGANVWVRGFPGGGDAPFLTLSLQGSPVYPAPTLSFLENSQLFRIDDTIEMVEGLRGGPNPVVSNGQPGLTTNFRLKRGGESTEATAKYTTSDYGLNRVDLVLSGALADDLYYMVGGYVKSSPGIRDAGFSSEEGHQVTVNLTKVFDKGELNLYTRQTDDHGTWYLPTPLNVEGIDAEYTQIGPRNRQATIVYGADNEQKSFDFGDGRGWDGHVSGGSLSLDLGDNWRLVDRFNLTKGQANTFGLVPNGAATTVGEVREEDDVTGAVTGQAYGDNTPIQQIGRWVVLKDIEAFTNDLALSRQFGTVDTSVGLYTATTKAEDWWSIGNHAYYVLQPGGEMLSGIACNVSDEGCGWNYDINSTGDARTTAFYATAKWFVTDELDVDLGIRRENHEVTYSVDEGLDNVINKAVDYDESKTSWTAGVNYALNDVSGVFARINRGYKMPYFDDFRDNWGAYSEGGNLLIKEVSQAELGYKYMDDAIRFFATAFSNEVKGDTFVRVPGAPAEILTNEAYGLELDGTYDHESGFSLNLNATLQETEITESPTNEGNEAQRQPGWQVRMTPSYAFEVGDGMFGSVYATLTAVDDRFGNNENTVVLEGYEKIDLGVIFEPTESLKLQLSVDNLTDKLGLTEGDPRNADAPNGRYIMPRSIKFSVAYTLF